MKRITTPLAALLLLTVCARTTSAADQAADRASIIQGVNLIASPGVPGTLCAFAQNATIIADAPTGRQNAPRRPIIAAATYGKGRIIAFAHDGYFKSDALAKHDTARLIANLLRWSTRNNRPARVGAIGLRDVSPALQPHNIQVADIRRENWQARLRDHDAVFFPFSLPASDTDSDAIASYINEGGTALVAYTGWGWLSLNKGKSLHEDMPANRLLTRMGLAITDGTVEPDPGAGGIRISKQIDPALHAAHALDLLANTPNPKDLLADKARAAQLTQAGETVMQAALALPADTPWITRLKNLTTRAGERALP